MSGGSRRHTADLRLGSSLNLAPRLVAVALLLGTGSCQRSFELLGPADTGPPDAEPTDAGGEPGTGTGACPRCSDSERCHVDRCVDVSGVRSLGCHFSHTCYLSGGALYCFGRNTAGQLGTGVSGHRNLPTRVGDAADWISVSVGEESTCGLRAPGQLYCWGNNSYGQLGHGDTDNRLRPTRVAGRDDWLQVACGGWSCCAVSARAGLHCWGANLEGKPGQDDQDGAADLLVPTAVAGLDDVVQLANGQGHVCALTARGTLYCWGRNSEGQTGVGAGRDQYRAPAQVGSELSWASVSAGLHHTCALTGAGALYCWGENTEGETGLPGLGQVTAEPTRVGRDSDWVRVAVGGSHSCALKGDGRALCWGRGAEGQLGRGTPDAEPAPNPVQTELHFQALALGPFHTCGLSTDDQLYCWGANDYGQLGVGDDMARNLPTAVAR